MAEFEFNGKTYELDADGHLKNLGDWNEELAAALAKTEEINELTPRHWDVINFMRKVFEEKGDAPSMRKMKKEGGIETKELYELFPKGPAKKASKIAGLPKPKGCV